MKAQISTSNLSITAENYTLKAWHLAAVLLSIGRPTSLTELAEKCTVFRVSPEFIEFLCSIPNSPIFLTENDVVLLSASAFRVVGEFFAVSMPKVQIEVFGATAMFYRRCGDVERKYFRKRKRLGSDILPLVKKRVNIGLIEGNILEKERFSSNSGTILAVKVLPHDMPNVVALNHFSDKPVTSLMATSNTGLWEFQSKNNEDQESRHMYLMDKMETSGSSCTNLDQHDENTSLKSAIVLYSHDDLINRQVHESKIKDVVELPLYDCGSRDGRAEKEKPSLGSCGVASCLTTAESFTVKKPTFRKDVPLVPSNPQFCSQKTPSNISAVTLKQKSPSKLQKDSKVDIFRKKTKGHKDEDTIGMRDKAKHIPRNNAASQEKCGSKSIKGHQKSKYPEFESYTVEEEEGSGGYGTVYRARRKTDGLTFAIKCPHANAHIHHLKNELRMLQRFGGKNNVIKYEDSLKSGNADCFVLEHVEHDRPEVLKREIDVNQLQWYGFCLFKALASIHKQGVFHRDVKPGNFLFSCKTKRGYLIDFNLAKDLHQKPRSLDKSEPHYMSATKHVQEPQQTFASTSKRRKILSEAFKAGATRDGNHNLESKILKRKGVDKLKAYDDFGRRNSIISQGVDKSGLTSKDLTSTRTSGERRREPIPCQGRKELISLAQEAMQISNLETGSAPVFRRKRVAASPVVLDRKFIHLSPTPLHSAGNCVAGAMSLKNRGDKPHKEGPCVGTKGFRAPEVLLRSLFQGPKMDTWSAGVTLLYLITGKMPFTGDPEQNMKDIVKLKGNEELWEVAKLHNRESSIPVELLDIKYLESMTIKEWCVVYTKRIKFLDVIPDSLFDLIEKCLIVNPRLRITAEEALRHEFFAPCHDVLQRTKSRRPSQNQHSRSNSLPLLHEPVTPVETPNTSQFHL